MKPLTDTLKTLITEHSIDILQQEQRLKAMLADLLPHDKQMRFLLELSLRAQIPQKLIAQQNETRLSWEAQIKSLKHYFKDEYFLEDKAVDSVFDCWVEVLPRKKQAAAPPKLGNLNADSKFKKLAANRSLIITAKMKDIHWMPFFNKIEISNHDSLLLDTSIINEANHINSYPKLTLPLALSNEIAKSPQYEFFSINPEDIKEDLLYENENKNENNQLIAQKIESDYIEYKNNDFLFNQNLFGHSKKDNDDFIHRILKDNKLYLEREERLKLNEQISVLNQDKTKTFSLEQFVQLGSLIGYNLFVPKPPKSPRIPKKENLPVESKKEDKVSKEGLKNFLIALMLTALGLLFIYVWKYVMPIGGAYVLLFWPAIVFIPIGFVSLLYVFFILYKSLANLFTITKAKKKKLLVIQERKSLEAKNEREYQEDLAFYNNELLPQYEKEYKTYETKRNKQVKVLNEAFPLIAQQIWLQAMVANTNVFSPGNSTNNGTLVKNLVARLGLQYPEHLIVNTKVFDFQSEIILNIDNKICINIEIDEPFNRETSQETHFVGSND